MGRGYFFVVDRNHGGGEANGPGDSFRIARLPSAAAREQCCRGAIRYTGRFVCALPDAYADSHCSGLVIYAAGAVAIQFHYSCASFTLAQVEWASFCGLWICDWNFSADHEFWDAGDRRCQSSCGDRPVRIVFFVGTKPGVLADQAARNYVAPRVDDSGILDWAGGSYYTADYRNIFRDEPDFRTDTARILWYRVLDWFCAAPDCCGGLDSRNRWYNNSRNAVAAAARTRSRGNLNIRIVQNAISEFETVYFLWVVLRMASGIMRRATGLPPMMCDSMISSTSSGFTLPYQTASG